MASNNDASIPEKIGFGAAIKAVAGISWQTYRAGWFWGLVLFSGLLGGAVWELIVWVHFNKFFEFKSVSGATNTVFVLLGLTLVTTLQYQWRRAAEQRTFSNLAYSFCHWKAWGIRAVLILLTLLLWYGGTFVSGFIDSAPLAIPVMFLLVSITVNFWSWTAEAMVSPSLLKGLTLKGIFIPKVGLSLVSALLVSLWFLTLLFASLARWGHFVEGFVVGGMFMLLALPPAALATINALGADISSWHHEFSNSSGTRVGPVPTKVWWGVGGAVALALAFYAGSAVNTPQNPSAVPEPDTVADAAASPPVQAEITPEQIKAQKAEQARQAEALYDAKEYKKAQALALEAASGEYANADAQLLMYRLGANPAGLEAFQMPTSALPNEIAAAAQERLDMSAKVAMTWEESIEWLEKSAKQGHVKANAYLGMQYLFGSRVAPKNYTTALKHIRFAADRGSNHAQQNLGYMYQEGFGVTKDQVSSFNWYKRSADGGSTSATRHVAWSYDQGWGVAKSLTRAISYFRKAAEAGDAEAQSELGHRLISGIGTPKDYNAARYWLAKAAKQGDVIAIRNIGVMYENGYGVREDDVQAYKLFLVASDLGDRDGAYFAGNTLWGLVKHDSRFREQIRRFYRIAIDRGHPEAASALADYNVGARFVGAVEGLALRTLVPLATGDAKALEGIMNEQYKFIDQIIEQAAKR